MSIRWPFVESGLEFSIPIYVGLKYGLVILINLKASEFGVLQIWQYDVIKGQRKSKIICRVYFVLLPSVIYFASLLINVGIFLFYPVQYVESEVVVDFKHSGVIQSNTVLNKKIYLIV